MKKCTIEHTGTSIVAFDDGGLVIASRKRNCNPAALAQLICAVECDGYVIDWQNSGVAKPEPLTAAD